MVATPRADGDRARCYQRRPIWHLTRGPDAGGRASSTAARSCSSASRFGRWIDRSVRLCARQLRRDTLAIVPTIDTSPDRCLAVVRSMLRTAAHRRRSTREGTELVGKIRRGGVIERANWWSGDSFAPLSSLAPG